MHGLFYINKNTEQSIDLMNQKDRFIVYEVKGLEPVDTTVSGSRIVGGDGVEITDVYAGKRNIVLSLALRKPIDDNRQMLFSYFNPKDEFTLRITVGNMSGSIDGYVEKVEVTENGELQNMQISMVCPEPMFRGIAKLVTSSAKPTATLNYTNHGAEPAGFELKIEPTLAAQALITIDVETPDGKHLKLKDVQMNQKEGIRIDTVNQKVEKIDGQPITNWEHGNEWLTLPIGSKSLKVTVTNGAINSMMTSLKYSEEYWGL